MSLELSAINTVGEMKKSNPCEIIDCAALVNDFVFCFFFLPYISLVKGTKVKQRMLILTVLGQNQTAIVQS